MTEVVSYKIRFFDGVDKNNECIYTYKELTSAEYEELYDSLLFYRFSKDIEKAYELIVFNYRDYELNNFTTTLNNVLSIEDANSNFTISNNIDRHISNILTSTYVYTSLFKIKRENTKINDYSIDNSKEIAALHELKTSFKNITNEYHREHYQYTFISALRNRINHGGNLDKLTELGGTWSIRYEPIELGSQEMRPRKDKRYSLFDQKILKSEAKNIIDNNNHYSAVESIMPEFFYVREAMRIYIDLLSTVHSKIRIDSNTKLKSIEELVLTHRKKQDRCIQSSLIKYVGSVEKIITNIGHFKSLPFVKAPLYLEHYAMPGEPAAVPKCR